MSSIVVVLVTMFIIVGCGNAVSGAGSLSGSVQTVAQLNAKVDELNATIKELDLLNNKLVCYLAVERACKTSNDSSCNPKGNEACDKAKN